MGSENSLTNLSELPTWALRAEINVGEHSPKGKSRPQKGKCRPRRGSVGACLNRLLPHLQDMRQVWDNCISFNGKATKYGKVGDRSSAMFEELWAASGLDTGGPRHRRSTAGVAAAKYEPQEEAEAKRPIRKQPQHADARHQQVRAPC